MSVHVGSADGRWIPVGTSEVSQTKFRGMTEARKPCGVLLQEAQVTVSCTQEGLLHRQHKVTADAEEPFMCEKDPSLPCRRFDSVNDQ